MNQTYTINAFFPTTGANLMYTARTLFLDSPVNGSYIQFQRFINGSYRTVAEGITGSGGIAPFYLTQNAIYFVTITNPYRDWETD